MLHFVLSAWKSFVFFDFNSIKNIMEKEQKIHLSGCELVSLAGSLSICLAEKLCDEDVRKLRFFFSSISSNLAIIEAEGRRRKN